MKSRRADFVLGLFVLGALALFLASVLFIYPTIGTSVRQIRVRFAHDEGVAPLRPASAVLLGGSVQVGKVRSVGRETATVELDGKTTQRLMIVVDAEIESDLMLYDDCAITTDQPPVGGPGVLVILSVGTPERGPVGAAPIRGLPAQSFAASIGSLSRFLFSPGGFLDKLDQAVDGGEDGSLMNRLLASLEDVNAITRELRTQLTERDAATLLGKIQTIAANLADLSEGLRTQFDAADQATLLAKVLGALDQLQIGLAEATELLEENRPPLRSTVASLQSLSQTLDEQLGTALRRELNRDDPASLVGKIHEGVDRLNRSLDALAVATDAAKRLIVINKPALDDTVRHVNEMSRTLSLASEEIRLAPWRLAYRPSDHETRETRIFEATRTFAAAVDTLDGAVARLRALEEAAAAGDGSVPMEEFEQMRDALRSAFDRFEKAEQFLFERLQ